MEASRCEFEEDIGSVMELEEPEQPMVLNIYNVLASANTGVNIDLLWFTENFGNTYYDPQEFPAARADIPDRHTKSVVTISAFSNGKIQATGGVSVECTKNSLKKVVRKLRNKGFKKAKLLGFEVHNIQAVIDAGFPIDLRVLREIYVFVDYEPERNPGLRIRIPVLYLYNQGCNPEFLQRQLLAHQYGTINQNKGRPERANPPTLYRNGKIEIVTLTIHFSGKIGMAGGRSVEGLQKVLDYIKPYLIRSRLV
ncbi:transcription factor TFIID [Cryptosporidium sp. chipmunk genotype I]|uniref:transcription factor TFIID n=1 Tax=Cryptosporidium sp. chipmunk genotype I TaxID=1280935 RepID=UPI00351AAC13|nr:transcription factor TFIID [Cryptosporidium sp. chipmunk genotype I]